MNNMGMNPEATWSQLNDKDKVERLAATLYNVIQQVIEMDAELDDNDGVNTGKFFYDSNTGRTDKGVYDPTKQYQTIQALSIDKQFNMIERLDGGQLQNVIHNFDLFGKKYSQKFHNYYDGTRKSLNPNELNSAPWLQFSLKSPASVRVRTHTTFGSDDATVERALSRPSLGLLSSVEMDVKIFGRTDLEVGDTIRIEVPKSVGGGSADAVDEILTGKYLITNICHVLVEKQHMMVLKVTTDSYSGSIT